MVLTRQQFRVYDFIRKFLAVRGYSPSYKEIAEHLGLSSVATIHKHISNLEQKGLVRKGWNRGRSLEVVPMETTVGAREIPLEGRVAAGEPIEAIRDGRTISVPEDLMGRRGKTYALLVKGDSMIDEQIRDGDVVIVEARNTAENGEMVVALIRGESATLKKFYQEEDGRIRLQPANPAMEPIYVDPSELVIQGVVVGLIRKFR